MKKNKNAKQGFTLIEVIIVLALLAILAALGIYSFAGVRASAADDAAYKKLYSIEDAFLYSRTTNGYDNDKAIENVGKLVSVEGTYRIEVGANTAGEPTYTITYFENGKEYIASNTLYDYDKPDDNGKEEGGNGGGDGEEGGDKPDPKPDPDDPDTKPDNPDKDFIIDTNELYIYTHDIIEELRKKFDDKNINKDELEAYLNELLKEKFPDKNITVDTNGSRDTIIYDFISKMYYDGSWPTIPGSVLEKIGIATTAKNWYIRPVIPNNDFNTTDIILYASPNEQYTNGEKSPLIFKGTIKEIKDEHGKTIRMVEGTWYHDPNNKGIAITGTIDVDKLKIDGWKEVKIDITA